MDCALVLGNELSFTVRNASGRALTLGVTLVFHGPERSHSCGDLSITVEAERAAPVCLPVQLADPGGGLLVLTIRADAESFWLPILTYVEDVSCVLRSVEQILRDTPHAERARRAAALRQAVESWRPGGRPAGLQWSAAPAGRGGGAVLLALRCAPSRPVPPPWGSEILSFLRDVQPVLNARCIACHTHDRRANRVILTDDLTDQFTVGYEELLPYVSVANATRWDCPEDVAPQPPYTYGSNASRLVQLLAAGHHGVQLTEDEWERVIHWVDANGVYYDRYETSWPDRRILSPEATGTLSGVFSRRCSACHSGNGWSTLWWLSINRHDVRQSRALAAPLARSAGGWGRCEGTVFASPSDPDYQRVLGVLAAIHDRLQDRPREDLVSIRGTAAEQQLVALPPPPPRAPRRSLSRLAAMIGLVGMAPLLARRCWAARARRILR